MTRLDASTARMNFSETVNRVAFGSERIVLERHGKAVLALVPVADLELLEALEDRIDLDQAREALADVKKRGAVPWERIKAKLKL